MLTASPFDPGLLPSLTALVMLLMSAWLCGWLLVPARCLRDCWLTADAARLISGLVFLSGVAATWCLQRFCFVSMLPVIQVGFAFWDQRHARVSEELAARNEPAARERWWLLAAILVGCVVFEWWNSGWVNADGSPRLIHLDLSYFAQTVRGLMESRVADGWSAALGEHTRESPDARDAWYHWGPMWLAAGVCGVTRLPSLAALMHVTATALDVALVLVVAAIVKALTGYQSARSFIFGTASLIAVQIARVLGEKWFALTPGTNSMQLGRFPLAFAFSYKFEASVMLLAIVMWLRQRRPFAGVLLACAALSSPHAVAMGGVTAGIAGVAGVLTRRRALWQTSAWIIGILLLVWSSLHIAFHVGLPKASGQSLIQIDFNVIRLSLRRGVVEACTGLALGALSLPGIIWLIMGRNERASEESRMLGWLALSGIIGSFIGLRLLDGVADSMHFVFITHAVLVMPAGIWGLASMLHSGHRVARPIAIVALALSTAMGAWDLVHLREQYSRTPWKAGELEPLKAALRGRPFGYFAKVDRPWWMSKHSSIAAVLDVRCLRLQQIEGEADEAYARYYGFARPYQLVPTTPQEPADLWSLRFARHMGIERLIEFGSDTIPDAVKKHLRAVISVPHATLYELLPEGASK